MNRELKPLDRVREAELGLIAEPYHATRDLVTARQHRSLIRNLEEWWDRCLHGLDRRDGRSKELAWERLLAKVMQGELVLVHNQSYPPPRPAFQQVDGVWSVAPYISSHRGGFRFKNRLVALDLERRERERWAQKQAAAASGPEGLPTEPAVIKPATLGPHVGGAASNSTPAPVPTAKIVKSGLGEDADKLVSKSPSLQRDLETLKKDNWKISYGPEGGGSYANKATREIVIDAKLKERPEALVKTLAHETGHATYAYVPDLSTKSSFVNGALADEGAATLNNIRVQREIIANGGPDIGIAGNRANHSIYNSAYDQYLLDENAAAAREL